MRKTVDNRGLAALISAGAISALGSGMSLVALPWFALELTGSIRSAAIVLAAEVIPIAVLGLFQARLVSRLGARRSLYISDGARAALVLAIPVLHQLELLTWPLLLGLVAGVGVFAAPHYAAERTLLARLSPKETQLVRVNAVMNIAPHLTRVVGPAAAGIFAVWFGADLVLVLDALSFAVSAVVVAAMVAKDSPSEASDHNTPSDMVRMLRESLQLRRALGSIVVMDAVVAISALVCLLALVRELGLAADSYGYALAAFGAGAVLGSSALAVFKRLADSSLTGPTAAALHLLPLWLLVMPGVTQARLVAVFFLIGVCNPIVSATLMARVAAVTPEQSHPQVFATVLVASQTFIPIGYIAAGSYAEAASAQTLALALAVAGTAISLTAARALQPTRARYRQSPSPLR